jgi:hypothetical protein
VPRWRLLAVALAALPSLAAGPCIPVYLVDADVDDDGVVDASDVSSVTACLGAVLPADEPAYDAGGCPIPGPPPPACAAADLDASGGVSLRDLVLAAARLGHAVCNGSELLCARRYDQVAYPTTHNAMAARASDDGFSIVITNQCQPVPVQLADGVRALMLDVHWNQPPEAPEPDLYLCHSDCDLGAQPLVEGLAEIRAFLEAHPAEVVTLIVETNEGSAGREAEIRDAFAESGLLPFAHAQQAGAPWPALEAMIASGRRLVVLTDDPDASGCGGDPCPWYHYLWAELAFETDFQNTRPSDFSCDDLRGEPGNDLFILNHFLTQNVGAPHLAQKVNHDPGLSLRALECWRSQGRIPNFVTVDFYEIGDLLRATNLLNFLAGQEGAPFGAAATAGTAPPPRS